MVQRNLNWLLLSVLAVSGCAAPSGPPNCMCSASVPLALDCQESVNSPLVPDVSMVRLPPTIEFDEKAGHCALREDDLQCLAASRSATASLLQAESEAARGQSATCSQRAVSLSSELLRLRSVHERNRASGAALTIYLRLAEAEGAKEHIGRSLDETANMLEDSRQFRAQGIQLPVTAGQIKQQRMELLHQQQELQLTILQLNSQLAQMLDLAADHAPVWPEVDLTVLEDVTDLAVAIEVAQTTRADLAALRRAARCLDRHTLPAVRSLILQATAGGGAGLSAAGGRGLLAARRRGSELPVRHKQVQEMIASEELKTRRDVTVAIRGIETRLQQIRLTMQTRDVLRDNVKNLRQQLDAGASTIFDLRQANLNLLSAETDLLHDVIQWKIAIVKLKELQGLLAEECGYSLCTCG